MQLTMTLVFVMHKDRLKPYPMHREICVRIGYKDAFVIGNLIRSSIDWICMITNLMCNIQCNLSFGG